METSAILGRLVLEEVDTRVVNTNARTNLKVGNIVLVVNPTFPRSSWPLARILETKLDSDGMVRSVKLQTKTSIIEQPIIKLCLLLEEEDH